MPSLWKSWEQPTKIDPNAKFMEIWSHSFHCWHSFYQEFQSPPSFALNDQSAMLSAPSAFAPTWYPDSGATNHITHDPNSLINNKPMQAVTRLILVIEQVWLSIILDSPFFSLCLFLNFFP